MFGFFSRPRVLRCAVLKCKIFRFVKGLLFRFKFTPGGELLQCRIDLGAITILQYRRFTQIVSNVHIQALTAVRPPSRYMSKYYEGIIKLFTSGRNSSDIIITYIIIGFFSLPTGLYPDRVYPWCVCWIITYKTT